ncbi:ATP-binding protein [Porticoccaceae bacterium]|nr:ATP-binding protein [Porticoccaceae bacterium]MDA8651641.1 ATP-binding protein [Porticoccaceae bacterium]MDA8682415.1 ATP-binding protein [Porticoccaceae bacterium]MDB2664446.1 ATP-binding protein [Porticoccaceae bacterium]
MNEPVASGCNFTVSDNIIKTLIKSQAGSVSKAVLELVMNCIDAQAHNIDVIISDDLNKISVVDDGVGFSSKSDIEAHFGNFGFDHTTTEEMSKGRVFGAFGLGRAQSFVWGRCTWTTGRFQIVVDIDGGGLDQEAVPYKIIEFSDTQHDGCRVDIELYKQLTMFEFDSLSRTLRSELKYVSVPIMLNQQLVNAFDSQWDDSIGGVYFKSAGRASERGLDVYNQGVFVRTYRHSVMGLSGDINSSSSFDLNTARNDVLQASCPLWPLVKQLAKKHGASPKKKSLTYQDGIHLIKCWFAGEIDNVDFVRQAVFTSAKGRTNRLSYVFSFAGGKVAVGGGDSQLNEKVHDSKLAYVFSPKMVDSLGFSSAKDLVDAINHRLSRSNNFYRSLSHVEFDSLTSGFQGETRILEPESVKGVKKARLMALDSINRSLVNIINDALGYFRWDDPDRIKRRALQLGKSRKALAWTDGVQYIAIDCDYLNRCFDGGFSGINQLISTLIHEYCHDSQWTDDHTHGVEFYNRFHDIVGSNHFKVYPLISNVMKSVIKHRRRLGLSIARSEVNVVYDDSIRKAVLAHQ